MYLITGSKGQLGSSLKKYISNTKALFLTKEELNISEYQELKNITTKSKVNAIINCTAYTAVDQAEEDEEACYKINVEGIKNLCDISAAKNIPLIHISTDYVFDGDSNTPYIPSDKTNPQSVYGQTKLEGEQIFIKSDAKGVIIRTSWLYSEFSKNFVKTMIKLGETQENINVVYDQIGTPTYALDLAESIYQIVPQLTNHKEILHFSNEGVASWYDFAYKVFDYLNIDCQINPVGSDKFITAAKRPHYSVLDKSKIKSMFGIKIRNWNEALEECLDNIRKENFDAKNKTT